jgi:hypothetical protein
VSRPFKQATIQLKTKRKRDQLKLTRTLIAIVFVALLSEISSIISYDTFSRFLFGDKYMETLYKLQVFISNIITLIAHSVNFFFYCAFNEKYLNTFRQRYSLCWNFITFKRKRNMPAMN